MQIFMTLLGIGDLLLALCAFFMPVDFVGYVDLAPTGPQAISEIRAMYCGVLLGLGAWQIWASRSSSHLMSALAGSGFIFGGLGLARGFALVLGEWTAPQMAYTVLELTICTICILFYRRHEKI